MNETQRKLANKVGRLTQRLETVGVDDSRTDIENARAAVQLVTLCAALERAVSHPTFSAEERVERMARAVDGATPNPRLMDPEIVKLERLVARIHALVPDPALSLDEKLDRLGKLFAVAFPDMVKKVG